MAFLELVYGVPNSGAQSLYNDFEAAGRIVMLHRGKVAIVTKVRHAERAGALGVIIVNNDDCEHEPDSCQSDFDRQLTEMMTLESSIDVLATDLTFLKEDSPSVWRDVMIPSVLISAADGDRLRRFMGLILVDLDGEPQYMIDIED
jgi:PA domain